MGIVSVTPAGGITILLLQFSNTEFLVTWPLDTWATALIFCIFIKKVFVYHIGLMNGPGPLPEVMMMPGSIMTPICPGAMLQVTAEPVSVPISVIFPHVMEFKNVRYTALD